MCELLRQAFHEHDTPQRLLSDSGPAFTSLAFELILAQHGVDHSLIRPAHPWTHGRIERLFRTFKEVYFGRPLQRAPLGGVAYFDGHLSWYRFGA